jgi:hypothetical protein
MVSRENRGGYSISRAGAILLGKTNAPEQTMAYETDSLVYGRTNKESISKRGLCGLLLNFQLLFVLHSRIPANEGLPELVIEHLRSDLQ